MFKLFATALTIAAIAISASSSYAACDKEKAREMLSVIERTVAKRDEGMGGAVVWYDWQDNWDKLTPGQKRGMVQGIGGMEQCLTGKAIRIRYNGKDVARYSLTGKTEIYE